MVELKLSIEDYCQDCNMFEPNTETLKMYSDDCVYHKVLISCEYRDHCKYLSEKFQMNPKSNA